MNRFVFWGLAKPPRGPKNPAEHVRKIADRYEEQAATFLKQGGASADVRGDVRRELEAHAAHLTDLLTKSAA